MTGVIHTVTGGSGVPERHRESVANAMIAYLDAIARVHEDVEAINHARATEFFSGEYDRVVEFASEELGFDIQIVGSEEAKL